MAESDSSDQILNFKNIHIGNLIKQRVTECEFDYNRICNFMKCSEAELNEMYFQKSLNSEILLKWSKLLSYDFFRIYSQHLIFYSPPSKVSRDQMSKQSELPTFRKSIYTQEVIDFILEQFTSKVMTRNQIMEHYDIPRTTLYKWIDKHKSKTNR